MNYLNDNGISREEFTAIRQYSKLTSKKAILGLLGAVTYSYDGNEIADLNAVCAETGKTYQQMIDANADYSKYVANGMGNYESDQIFENFTQKSEGVKSLAVYMVILLLVLIAMATFRSPAVALMPDVTPKPLRSQANAIINLCGGIGGAIAFLIYTIALFKPSLNTYVIIFGAVAAGMLLLLGGFLALVKEKKLVARCQEICKEYGIDDFDEDESPETKENAEKLLENGISEETVEFAKEVVENSKQKVKSPKEWWNGKTKDEKGKLVSFWLILASIFMWFMGYNAVSSNLSVYTTKGLNLSAGIASIISGVSMGISAIAFIPVGYLAAKIGRRKSIMIGYGLAIISFILICFAITQGQEGSVKTVLFTLFYLISGFGLIIANVNTFPMVTELSTAETVGAYTGYYYVATMSAQAITPFIAGWVMDLVQYKYLFLYSAVCIVIAVILMLFVKHGDSKQISGGKKLTKEEKKQIRLETLDSMDD
ncbi:MAG: MFS transporter [Clostridia bacterium]|nr:MFS transporter [Clostridia bacterium]